MDIHFIETARLQGLRAADVIVHICNWLAEKTPAPYWLTRAYDNGVYVLESNRNGLERTVQFGGGSVLINPDGTIGSYEDTAPLMYGEVDIEVARAKKFGEGGNKILERRPKDYMEIMQNMYLWNPLDYHGLYGYDPLPKGKKSVVSVAQVNPVQGDVEANIAIIAEKAAAAAAGGSELIVFPELMLTGPVDAAGAAKLAECVQGASVDKVIDISMKYHIYIVAGMVEKDGDALYNTAILTGPEGLAGFYRKMHLSEEDKAWAAPGNLGFPHFNTPVGRIGILIGHDAEFPEPGRLLALNGCDLICFPSAMRTPKSTFFDSLPSLFANPTQNGCFGRSGIFHPDTFLFPRNEKIMGAEDEGIISITMDTSNAPDSVYPTNVVRRKDLVCMRHPIMYDVIVDPKAPVYDFFK